MRSPEKTTVEIDTQLAFNRVIHGEQFEGSVRLTGAESVADLGAVFIMEKLNRMEQRLINLEHDLNKMDADKTQVIR